jgi:hypothetical protein
MKSHLQNLTAVFFLLTFTNPLLAQTPAIWSGTGDWTDASRWTSSDFPNNGGGVTYAATINSGTTTLDRDITVDELEVGQFGQIRSDDAQTITVLDEMRLTSTADIVGDGLNVVVDENARLLLDLSVGASSGVIREATIFNRGEAIYLGGRKIVNTNGTFENSGTLDLQADGRIFIRGTDNSGLLSNSGLVQKSSGLATTEVNIRLDNTGAVDVASGNLSFTHGVNSNGGQFTISEDATLEFSNLSSVSSSNDSFTGAGTLLVKKTVSLDSSTTYELGRTVVESGNLIAAGDIQTEYLELSNTTGGGVGRIGGGGQVFVTDRMEHGRGDVEGTVIVNAGATLNFNSGSGINGTLINNGQATMVDNLSIRKAFPEDAAALVNNGDFDLGSDGRTIISVNGKFVNNANGRVTKANGTGTATIQTDTFNAGAINVTGSTLSFTDSFLQREGEIVLDNAIIESTRTMDIEGGTLEGFGRFDADINLVAGTLSAGYGEDDVAQLGIRGDLAMAMDAIFSADIGGVNDGSQGTTSDHIGVEGDVILDGTLEFDLVGDIGTTLVQGDWAQLLASSTPLTGAFDNVASGDYIVESGYQFQVFYGEGSKYGANGLFVEFQASAVPEPSSGLMVFAFSTFIFLRRKGRKA